MLSLAILTPTVLNFTPAWVVQQGKLCIVISVRTWCFIGFIGIAFGPVLVNVKMYVASLVIYKQKMT